MDGQSPLANQLKYWIKYLLYTDVGNIWHHNNDTVDELINDYAT